MSAAIAPLPSGVGRQLRIQASAENVAVQRPSARFQMRSVLSPAHDMICVPPGRKCTSEIV